MGHNSLEERARHSGAREGLEAPRGNLRRGLCRSGWPAEPMLSGYKVDDAFVSALLASTGMFSSRVYCH
mgnify:CR=1 FL=1